MQRSGLSSAAARNNRSQLDDEERLLGEEYELDDTNYDAPQHDPLRPVPKLNRRKAKDEMILLEAMLRRKDRERTVQQTVARAVSKRDKDAALSNKSRGCSTGCRILLVLIFVLVASAASLALLFSSKLKLDSSRLKSPVSAGLGNESILEPT